MSKLYDLYKQTDEDRIINARYKAIDDHNRDIDIIDGVIENILYAAEANYPLKNFTLMDVEDELSGEVIKYVAWEFYHDDGIEERSANRPFGFYVLSDGRIIYSGCGYDHKHIIFKRADRSVMDLTDYKVWEFSDGSSRPDDIYSMARVENIRRYLVWFAVDQLGIVERDSWLYTKRRENFNQTQDIIDLLSQISKKLDKYIMI